VSPHPVIQSLTITTPGIQKLLDNINPHKASGPDNISGRILKDLQNFTAPILTIIFQKSLQTGCIPSDWKHEVTGAISDDSPSRTTVCIRFDKKAEIQFNV
jgi:hypothetical protein